MRSYLLAALTGAFLAAPLAAQGRDTFPRASLLAGVGNGLGWFGLAGELFVGPSRRVSMSGGLGHTIGDSEFDGTVAGALAVRGFTAGMKHRGFLEASFSLLAQEIDGLGNPLLFDFEQRNAWGPALAAGYRFTSTGGFTLMVSGGMGYAPSLHFKEDAVPVLNLALGYTWRR